jgi:hypothetical protein
MFNRTVFNLRDRVTVKGRYAGRIDYFLSNGRILVVDDAGSSRAYYPDQLQLVRDDSFPVETPPVCPTPAKLQEALELIEALMERTRNGATLIRLHSLVSAALSAFFVFEDDSQAFTEEEETVYVGPEPPQPAA